MKILIEGNINNSCQDIVIDYGVRAIKDGKGEFLYTDKKNNIGKHKGVIHRITAYVKDDKTINKVASFRIGPSLIKNMYEQIIQIENLQTEEFIYD